ncbi:MAG: sulfur carrier protein ThiS [Kiritimatiellaeota bacterium]|nr:sulfur carrier protein ThiS [Kiritimatiellota bacterium]
MHTTGEDDTVFVNGIPRPRGGAQTLTQLFRVLGVNAAHTAVERNGEIIPAVALAQTPVMPDDRIEIIQFVGGG